MSSLDELNKTLNGIYRASKTKFIKLERDHHFVPTTEKRDSMMEAKGFMSGIKRAIDHLERKRNDNEFEFDGGGYE